VIDDQKRAGNERFKGEIDDCRVQIRQVYRRVRYTGRPVIVRLNDPDRKGAGRVAKNRVVALFIGCTVIGMAAIPNRCNYGLLPQVIDRIEQDGFLNTIALYYFCYRFMTEHYSLDYFRMFRTELAENGFRFPNPELKNLYLLAINFCIRKMNEGNEPFIQEGWELYNEGLEKGFLLENKRLSPFTFNNIVAFGIKLHLYDDVERFIHKYREFLEATQQEAYVSFNLARLEYQRKHYDKALQYLQTADFKDLVNNLIAKTLLLKIYYELDEFDLLESHLDSFRSFIRRRELSDYHRQNYQNIIALVKKLTSIRPGDREALSLLRKRIEETVILTEREWLIEQLDKMP
jgi:tetratricopeptide (TPR) repeat protein